jgi:hypothetical protein
MVKHQDAVLWSASARHFPTYHQYSSSSDDSSCTPTIDEHTVSTLDTHSTTDGSFTSSHVSVCLCRSSSSASSNSLHTLDNSHER